MQESKMNNKPIDSEKSKRSVVEVKICGSCIKGDLIRVSPISVRCNQCEKTFLSPEDPIAGVELVADSTIEKSKTKTFTLRSDKKSVKNSPKLKVEKLEPELIEILSSGGEEENDDYIHSAPLNGSIKAELTENTLTEPQNGETSFRTHSPVNSSIKYVFKEWDIKENDCEQVDAILNCKPYEHNDQKKVSDEDIFEVKVKDFRIGKNILTEHDCTLLVDNDCLRFTYKVMEKDDDLQIVVLVCSIDIIFCALVFHNPIYAMVIKIKDNVSELFLTQLRESDCFLIKHLDKDNTRISFILDIKKNLELDVSQKLHRFFKKMAVSEDLQVRSSFIKLAKSKQLIYSLFGGDDKNLDVANFTKECYAKDLAKPLLKYASGDDSVVICNNDLLCLQDGVFLNDNIISFYLKYLQYEIFSEQNRKRTLIFDTLFYHCLTAKSKIKNKEKVNLSAAEVRHSRVKNWTRNVDIFKKDFLIFPINKSSHWFLVIVCYPYLDEPQYDYTDENMETTSSDTTTKQNDKKRFNLDLDESSNDPMTLNVKKKKTDKNEPKAVSIDSDQSADEADDDDSNFSNSIFTSNKENNKTCLKMPVILVFDSLLSTKKTKVANTLKEYLQCEWKAKHGEKKNEKRPASLDKLASSNVQVPEQENFFDCGIYLLQYVEMFFQDPITNFCHPINKKSWFKTELMDKKREFIKTLILTKSRSIQAKPNAAATPGKPISHSVLSSEEEPIVKLNGNHTLTDQYEESQEALKQKKNKPESHHEAVSRTPFASHPEKSINSSKKDPEKTQKVLDGLRA